MAAGSFQGTASRSAAMLPMHWPQERSTPFVVSDKGRDRGIHILAGSGSGKSVVTGQLLCFLDFLRGVPQVLFDPHGPLIDNFLFRVAQFPVEVRRLLWSRIRYVDLGAAAQRVVPFPLFYSLGGESHRDIADRFLTVIRKLDPHLESASIQGWNALYRVGAPTGIILSALGAQITAAPSLLREPELWESKLSEAVRRCPEVAPAADFFRYEYMPLKPGERASQTNSYLTKIAPFVFDPNMRAVFATTPPGIDLHQVVDQHQTVLLDFRGETNPERRHFKTRWLFEYLMSFIKYRGAGRHPPLSLVIDELTELTNRTSLEYDLFAADLDELINIYARNYSVWLTLAHQEMFQVSAATCATLLTMGTQMFGVTADMKAAYQLAEQYGGLDPSRVKRHQNVWGSPGLGGASVVLERIPVDLPLEEQRLLEAREFLRLRPFEFLVKRRDVDRLVRVNARPLLTTTWANERPDALAYIRYQLSLRAGVPLPTPAAEPRRLGRGRVAETSATYGAGEDEPICDPKAAVNK